MIKKYCLFVVVSLLWLRVVCFACFYMFFSLRVNICPIFCFVCENILLNLQSSNCAKIGYARCKTPNKFAFHPLALS